MIFPEVAGSGEPETASVRLDGNDFVPQVLTGLTEPVLLELAIASGHCFIATYNLKHFVGAEAVGIRAIPPVVFLRMLEGRP